MVLVFLRLVSFSLFFGIRVVFIPRIRLGSFLTAELAAVGLRPELTVVDITVSKVRGATGEQAADFAGC